MIERREVLKWGLLGAAFAMATRSRVLAQLCPPQNDPHYFKPVVSPPTKPFAVPLPVMKVLPPLEGGLSPAPNLAAFQRYEEFPARRFFEIHTRPLKHRFHPELPPSPMFGYEGTVPGPTIQARYGEPIVVRIHNNLIADDAGFGISSITTHLHSGHSASESDGFPSDYYGPGEYHDYHYVNFPAGGDPREITNTLWYHDHRHGFTAQNIARGLAAFCILFDEGDSGNERDSRPSAFRLPSGEFDLPLLFADQTFDPKTGLQWFDVLNTDGVIGDKYTVNGAIQPFVEVQPRKYRLRLLNAGPSRFYTFALSSGQPFIQIATDGNMLPAPVKVSSVTLGVAQRADVIVDFSQARRGERIYLLNRMEQTSGLGPTGRQLSPGDMVMRLDVTSKHIADPSRVPERLRPMPPAEPAAAVRERLWKFDLAGGAWTINGKLFDPSRSSAEVKLGSAEVWTMRNESSKWWHPVHIHLESFQILSVDGRPLPPGGVNAARKDTLLLGPNQEIKLFMRFRDFLGKYLIHCHNALHEDHSMMMRWDVVS